jgi:hypothetical protein
MRGHCRESSRNFPGRNGPCRKTTGQAGPALVVARTGRAEKFRPVLSSSYYISNSVDAWTRWRRPRTQRRVTKAVCVHGALSSLLVTLVTHYRDITAGNAFVVW